MFKQTDVLCYVGNYHDEGNTHGKLCIISFVAMIFYCLIPLGYLTFYLVPKAKRHPESFNLQRYFWFAAKSGILRCHWPLILLYKNFCLAFIPVAIPSRYPAVQAMLFSGYVLGWAALVAVYHPWMFYALNWREQVAIE